MHEDRRGFLSSSSSFDGHFNKCQAEEALLQAPRQHMTTCRFNVPLEVVVVMICHMRRSPPVVWTKRWPVWKIKSPSRRPVNLLRASHRPLDGHQCSFAFTCLIVSNAPQGATLRVATFCWNASEDEGWSRGRRTLTTCLRWQCVGVCVCVSVCVSVCVCVCV